MAILHAPMPENVEMVYDDVLPGYFKISAKEQNLLSYVSTCPDILGIPTFFTTRFAIVHQATLGNCHSVFHQRYTRCTECQKIDFVQKIEIWSGVGKDCEYTKKNKNKMENMYKT